MKILVTKVTDQKKVRTKMTKKKLIKNQPKTESLQKIHGKEKKNTSSYQKPNYRKKIIFPRILFL